MQYRSQNKEVVRMLDPKLGRCYTPYECKCIYYYLPINKIWYPTYYIFSEDVKNQS